jgi:hypothetical protein
MLFAAAGCKVKQRTNEWHVAKYISPLNLFLVWLIHHSHTIAVISSSFQERKIPKVCLDQRLLFW